MKRIIEGAFSAAVATVALIGLVSCGGGGGYGGGGGSGGGGTPIIASGAITAKGSITVGGIKYDDTLATVTADDSTISYLDLQLGQTVKVKGRRNDDGITGTADRIEVENEVRGAVAGLSGDSFTVHDQTVVVDSNTVLDGGITFSGGTISGLTNGENVEVHGQRLADGTIMATRMEKLTGAFVDEVRGIVSNLVLNTSFNIGSLTITYDGGTPILPAGATLTAGALVEIHLSGTTATRIEIEDAEDAEFEPAEGQEVEVEGFIVNFDGTSDFEVNGVHVHLTASTRYEGGVLGDIADDVKIEAEGHMSGGVLVADKISFKDTIRIEAPADGNGSPDVLGLTIATTSATDLSGLSGGIGGIPAGDRLRIRGFANADGSVTATRIDDGGGGGGDVILQGPVHTILPGPTYSFHILNIAVDAANVPPAEVKNDNDVQIGIDTFFAALTENKTIVKARGTYGGGIGGTLTADKIELE